MIRKAVQIGERIGIDRRGFVQGDGGPLGTADNAAGLVKQRDCHRSARQNETGERRKGRIHCINLFFQSRDLPSHDPQGMLFKVCPEGCGDVGTEVKHLILDTAETVGKLARLQRGDRDSNRAVRFINLANGGQARRGFRNAAAVDQPG